jgi:hypothetical protein
MSFPDRQRESDETNDELLDEVDSLTSLLVDDELDDSGRQRLHQLLENSPTARLRYFDAMRLHADLADHYRTPAPGDSKPPSPVIPPLSPAAPSALDGPPQVAE